MPRVIEVTVKGDHLEGLAHPARSLGGIVEMIWNAVDAEATEVRVTLTQSELDGVASVEVTDNGHGMTPADAERDFATLGGSWKLHAERSKNGERLLHGRRGQGRWRALSVGSLVRWITVAEIDGARVKTKITAQRSALTQFNIDDSETTGEEVGTRVVIENVDAEPASALLADDAGDVLTTSLALYSERYPNVELSYRGIALDPSKLQINRETYEIPTPTNEYGPATLTVIEWNKKVERELLLCDQNGMTLAAEHPGIQAVGFEFTSYLSWAGFRAHEHELATAGLHPVTGPLIETAKDKLRDHFRARAAELQAGVLEQWKSEDVYPYNGEATSDIEKVERDLFDVVAATAARAVNSSVDKIGKRFSLRLLRQAIEQSPSALRRVLHEVLELPEARLRELDELLDQTSLTAIIALGKIVANRLDFIAGLKELVFDPKTKKQVLERRQLHRILADEAWIFGDEYTLAVDDEGLKARGVQILDRARGPACCGAASVGDPVCWRSPLIMSAIYLVFCRLLELVVLIGRRERSKELEILVLRHELSVLRRQVRQPRFEPRDRLVLAALSRVLPRRTWHAFLMRPDTVLSWHRRFVARRWTYPHRKPGRPPINSEVRELVLRLARENSGWGYLRIVGEMRKLGITVSATSVRNVLMKAGLPPAPQRDRQSWRRFLQAHGESILACDFFTVDTIWLRRIYVLGFLSIGSRRIEYIACTSKPNTAWMLQQARNLLMELDDRDQPMRFMLHDRDTKFPRAFDALLGNANIRIIRTPVQAPNANAYMERWIGTVRRECLDRMLIVGHRQLAHVLHTYIRHYNRTRPHRALDLHPPDAAVMPLLRSPTTPHPRQVTRHDLLGGLIHEYELAAA